MKTLVGVILAALAALPANAQEKLPCEPSAACALQMARDAAFRGFTHAADARERAEILQVLTWVAEQDSQTNGATLRPRFVALRASIDQMKSQTDRQQALALLAQSLAASDLAAEALAIEKTLPTEAERDAVHASLAKSHARRGRPREAFAALEAMSGAGYEKVEAFSGVLNGITSRGDPALVREAAKYMSKPDPILISGMVVLAKQSAGDHQGARADALLISDANSRMASLYLLHKRYLEKGPDAEVLPTARLLVAESRKLNNKLEFEETVGSLVEALENAHQYTEALTWIPEVAAGDRGEKLAYLASVVESPADMTTVTKLLGQVPKEDRPEVEEAITLARIKAGVLKASDALKAAEDPAELADKLIYLVYDLGPERKDEAHALLMTALPAAPDPFGAGILWTRVAHAETTLGFLEEARKNIDQHLDEGTRASALLELSFAQAKRGSQAEAKRTRAEALREFEASGVLDHSPDAIALVMVKSEMLDDAETELRRLMAENADPRAFRTTPGMLIFRRVQRGELKRAFEFAAALSTHLGDDPEPFTKIYSALTRTAEPLGSSRMLEGLKPLRDVPSR